MPKRYDYAILRHEPGRRSKVLCIFTATLGEVRRRVAHLNDKFSHSYSYTFEKPKKEAARLPDGRPVDWEQQHHKHCGTVYRGCHPRLCPKEHWELFGEWKTIKELERLEATNGRSDR